MSMNCVLRSALAVSALFAFSVPAVAQLTRIQVGGLPTNLKADWSEVFWAPANAPGEFYLLAPFSGAPAGSFVFDMFDWDSHPEMFGQFPGGWYEVGFSFPEWAYLSNDPCGMSAAPGFDVPHGGIESTFGYGGSLQTGPALAVNFPLPGWVLGDAGRSISGHPTGVFDETFGLWLSDFFGNSLTGCISGTPVSWVVVRVQLSLTLR
ncbi:MAG: hypothetical protein VYE77_02615 [Planctomycetota bacterium]|nr:hypothetical protein [Planctomycetota bacterium]